MRFACGFAIALWLSSSATGMASRQQGIAGSTNTVPQAPPVPAAPAERSATEKAQTNPAPAQPIPTETKPAQPKTPEAEVTRKPPAASPPKKRHKRPASTPGAPRKIVVREGGASEPAAQIAPDMSPAEAALQRNRAEQILGSTDGQLKRLAERTLDARQRETVGQIHNYMDGARSALKEGDLRRAGTLAQKAHLLSEDLVKH